MEQIKNPEHSLEPTKKLLNSKITMVSGYGTGLALLFALFSHKIKLTAPAFNMLDLALSCCAISFSLLVTVAVSNGMATLKANVKDIENNHPGNKMQLCSGFVLLLAAIVAGWMLYHYTPALSGQTMTVKTLGLLLMSSGLILMYFTALRFFKTTRSNPPKGGSRH